MDTRITARHCKADDTLRQHTVDRVGQLERYFNGITDAHVIYKNGTPGHKTAEVVLNVSRKPLRACDSAATYERALDACIVQLRKQLLRHKDKLRTKPRGQVR